MGKAEKDTFCSIFARYKINNIQRKKLNSSQLHPKRVPVIVNDELW